MTSDLGAQPAASRAHIRVLIADDDRFVRGALEALLTTASDLEVVAAAPDADSAIEAARRLRPDVALLDVKMPGGGGLRAATGIREVCPSARSLAYSAYGDRESVSAMLAAGVLGYVVKSAPPAELLAAIRSAAAGGAALSPDVTTQVVTELASRLAQESDELRSRAERGAALRAVLERDLLRMLFQPIRRLDNGQLVGYEALARFATMPRRSPDLWFHDAAELGCLTDLELKAVRLALRDAAWLRGVYVAVNLSPATVLTPGLTDELSRRRRHQVVVEITEHTPIEDYAEIRRVLTELRSSGIRLAVDDLGSGYASLRHIVQLGPDILKVDMSLVRGIAAAPHQQGVVKTLVTFAEEFGAKLVAEGIETQAELDALAALGVTMGQGNHLGRPVPLAKPPSRGPSGAATARPLAS
ncbi:MAG TPA: EAL domain-containing protein [Candidatus Binatia bacterium]|nr:EAL domain-containing protein [Candidatus Binatia bacterium]